MAVATSFWDPNVVGLDLGGSLIKLVYYQQHSHTSGGKLFFHKFEANQLQEVIEHLQQLRAKNINVPESLGSSLRIVGTGGGACKHKALIREQLDPSMEQADEMECLIAGLNFLVMQLPFESFSYQKQLPLICEEKVQQDSLFPYLLVNIGSGVSMIKVSDAHSFRRISGTSLGGGTFWGLASLLTSASSFDEALESAKRGDHTCLDLLVRDIYGSGYNAVGLKGNVIASSFGKAFRMSEEDKRELKTEDVCASLLYIICNNIAQLAYLNAQVHGLKRIYFGGFFLRQNVVIMETISYGIEFWSSGTIQPYFLRHEGYLGALGAYLKGSALSNPSSPDSSSGAASLKDSFSSQLIGKVDHFPVRMKSPDPTLPIYSPSCDPQLLDIEIL